MKKRTFIIVISAFAVLILFVTSYAIFIPRNAAHKNEKRTEKTINKELMKTDADCGIVSVKMLLDFYEIDVTYAELEKSLYTSSDGTAWKNIKNYLNTLDNVSVLEFRENTEIAKEYLENGYPLFICWDVDKNPEWSHYSILISINKYSVWMLDPEEKKALSEYTLEYFLPCWKNENYWFCVLEATNKISEDNAQISFDKNVNPEIQNKHVIPDTLTEYISLLDTNNTDDK